MNFLKDEITKFQNSEKPTKKLYDILYNKVSIFINLVRKENEQKLDILNLPNKDQMNYFDTKNYKLYDLIFWFSFNEENINILFDPDTS